MRISQLCTKTQKTVPGDEQARNAQLLIQAGFIHKEMAGVYAYMPLGLKVLENIKRIVREEMNAVGANELMMTTLQPRDIWEKTDRWDDAKVDNWFKTKLANGSELGVGLTHEEPIVDAMMQYASSYKQFPFAVYQIQNKFRNELRAKSGLLRGREFVMKDAYSFSRNEEEHMAFYDKFIEAYYRVYERLGLGDVTYRCYADGGIFTNKLSDEFQVVSDVGEDTILVDESKKIAINEEIITDELLRTLGLEREKLVEKRGIEVGNTFHLETKYTDALGFQFADENGESRAPIMGCYGIGVSRLMGVIAEHFADDRGLCWPEQVAPAKVYLVRIGGDEAVREADGLYESLQSRGIEVLYDDRDERPGKKFADAELMGIPHRVTVSDRLLEGGTFEYVSRKKEGAELLTENDIVARIN